MGDVPVKRSNVHKGSHSFFSGGWDTHSVEAAREETGLDLHDLLVDLLYGEREWVSGWVGGGE